MINEELRNYNYNNVAQKNNEKLNKNQTDAILLERLIAIQNSIETAKKQHNEKLLRKEFNEKR